MAVCSHKTNLGATAFVRTGRNDMPDSSAHTSFMARRGVPTQVNWYLREWMDHLGVKQADMIRLTDWSKASASQLYNNKQDYSPKIVNEAAQALNVAPFELLMRPETAMALRRLRQDALRVVEDARDLEPPPSEARRAGKSR
jgi:transcriptional regulator with XRE-family HTH domain